jgi:heptosyltransferase-2
VSQSDPAQDAGRAATAAAPRVVVRLPNWVGDVCMALPALALLHAHGLALHCFGKAWAGELLAGLPYRVQRLPKGLFSAAAALRAVGAQRALSLTNSFGSALQLRLAGLRTVGYRKELRGMLLAVAVDPVAGRHECESFWRLAQLLVSTSPAPGVAAGPLEPAALPPHLELPLTAEHRAAARAALAAAGVTGSFSVLCPLSVGLSAGRSKQWPSFPLLCRGLLEQGDTVVACPGPGEEGACAAALPGARLLAGLGLGAYAGVMALSRRVVANDSGPLHLAAAVGAPVLGIFGVSDPARTRPWGEACAIVGDWHGWPTVQAVWETLGRLPLPAPAASRETRA